MNRGKVVWYMLVGINLFLLVLLGIQYGRQLRLQQGIAEKILRFHVLANSDSEEDQALKLAVRDAVGVEMAEALGDVTDLAACEAVIEEQLPQIRRTAAEVIAREGYDYAVTAQLCEVDFPPKTYGNFRFPAGTYEALEITIGTGGGHNWWCVMYPNMCFLGSVYEVVDESAEEALKEVLTSEEYQKVFTSGDYEVRFRYLTFLN